MGTIHNRNKQHQRTQPQKNNLHKHTTNTATRKVIPFPNQKKVNAEKRQKRVIAGVCMVLVGAGILFSPVFAIQNIQSPTITQFTTAELCEKIGLKTGTNAILFNRSKAEDILCQEPYIAQADIIFEFPNTFVITAQERKVRAYVPYMGSYLYIDGSGRVLEVQNTYIEGLPLVKGLDFSGFQMGEVLEVSNSQSLRVMLQISQTMEKYNFSGFSVTIDVSNPNEITAMMDGIQVLLGNTENMDQKIRNMVEIVETIPEGDRGILNLKDTSSDGSMIFQYLM